MEITRNQIPNFKLPIKWLVFLLIFGWFLFGNNQIRVKVYACSYDADSDSCTGLCPPDTTCQIVGTRSCECKGSGNQNNPTEIPTLNPLTPTPIIRCTLNVNGLTQSSSATDPVKAYEVLVNQTYSNAFSLAGQKNNASYQSNLQIFRSPMRKECWYGTDYSPIPSGCPADVKTEIAFPVRSVTGAYTLTTNFSTTDLINVSPGDYHVICYSFDPANVDQNKCSGNPWVTPPVNNFQYCGDSSRVIVHVLGPTLTPACTLKTSGDANCDGKIDEIDYAAWYSQFTTAGYGDKSASFDLNERVDLIDYEIWRKTVYALTVPTTIPTSTLTPEPSIPGSLVPPPNPDVTCVYDNPDGKIYGNFCWDTVNGANSYNLQVNANPEVDYLPPPGTDVNDIWKCILPTPVKTCILQELKDGQYYSNWRVGSASNSTCTDPRYFPVQQQPAFTCSTSTVTPIQMPTAVPTTAMTPTPAIILNSASGRNCTNICNDTPNYQCQSIGTDAQGTDGTFYKSDNGSCKKSTSGCGEIMQDRSDLTCPDSGDRHPNEWSYCRCTQ